MWCFVCESPSNLLIFAPKIGCTFCPVVSLQIRFNNGTSTACDTENWCGGGNFLYFESRLQGIVYENQTVAVDVFCDELPNYGQCLVSGEFAVIGAFGLIGLFGFLCVCMICTCVCRCLRNKEPEPILPPYQRLENHHIQVFGVEWEFCCIHCFTLLLLLLLLHLSHCCIVCNGLSTRRPGRLRLLFHTPNRSTTGEVLKSQSIVAIIVVIDQS